MPSRMCLNILRWDEQVLLCNKRLHSFEHSFLKDPVEIRNVAERSAYDIASVIMIILHSQLKIRMIFAIFSLEGYTLVKIDIFRIYARIPLITFEEHIRSCNGHEYKS